MKTSRIEVLGFKVQLRLVNKCKGGELAMTDSDTKHGKFSMTFTKISLDCIVHECWHLFMRIMQCCEKDNGFTFSELATEIYAITFEKLVTDTYNELCSMEKEK